jgi:hypothetical protein
MKANELRIGNKFECMGMVQTVFELCDNTDRGRIKKAGYEYIIRCEENGNQYKPIEIKPILLTKDWLLKLGAKKNQLPNGYWISVTNLKAELHFEIFDNTDEIVTTLISQSCELILDRIKYVHEYQNLYYTLTKCELSLSGI